MAFLRIVALGLVAAIAYGILHDQVTARVCLEYFTVGHPRLIDSESPTILGLLWGVVATWWVGLPLGLLLASAARLGKRPALKATDLTRPLRTLLAIMYACALVSGIVGFCLAQQGLIGLSSAFAQRVSITQHAHFLAAAFAHSASYGSGIIGGVILALNTFRRRGRLALAGGLTAEADELRSPVSCCTLACRRASPRKGRART